MPNTVAVSAFSIPDINYKGSIAKLRRYYTVNWTDQAGVFHLAGRPGSATDCFDEVECSLANHTLSVPDFTACITLFNGANPYAREIWQLWDQANKPRNIITGDAGWFIPETPTHTTREILEIVNQGQYLLWPPNLYLNEVGVLALINAQHFASPGKATLIAGVAEVERSAMTSNGAVIAAPLTAMSGNLYCEVEDGLFRIISTDGGDEGDVVYTAYDDLS